MRKVSRKQIRNGKNQEFSMTKSLKAEIGSRNRSDPKSAKRRGLGN